MLLLLSGIQFGGTCLAQGGYMVSGKVRGLAVARVHAVAADFGTADTLASAEVVNGSFMFRGVLPGDARCRDLGFSRGGRVGSRCC